MISLMLIFKAVSRCAMQRDCPGLAGQGHQIFATDATALLHIGCSSEAAEQGSTSESVA